MWKFSFNWLLIFILAILFIATVGRGFYVFYLTKNYDYLIETACNPASEKCFHRDCVADPENCPPDNLDDYRQFYLKASDFSRCIYNSCKILCAKEPNLCTEIKCGDDPSDTCSNASTINTTNISEQGTTTEATSSPQ